MSIDLRPHQNMAIDASIASPWQRQLIVMCTGLGKTITGLGLAKRQNSRMLWLAHTEELVTQPARAAALVWPEATRGTVMAERNEYMRQLVFASIQSAQQPRRLEQLAAQGFDLVVCDEAHHGLSPGYLALFQTLGCFRDGGPRLVGLTATPERTDNAALSDVFQGVVFQMGITSAIEAGYLVAPTVLERSINVDLDSVTTTRGDYGQRQLDVALMQAGIVQEIAAAYNEHVAGRRKALVFVVSVEQAEAVASALRAQGHAVAAVSGETDREERRRLLAKLKSGELSGLVNCQVLTEGFDEPSVDAVILARPTQSKPLMIQMIGRGLRLHPGKADCLVLDMVGVSRRHTLVQAAVLLGIRPDPAEERKPTNLDPIECPEEYWRERLRAQIKGVKGAPRSKLRWLPGNPGWLLPAGEFGTVRMAQLEGDLWRCDVVTGDGLQALSDQPVTLDTAQALAEDFVRRVDAVRVASSEARWRDGAASEKQVAYLKRRGVKNAEGLTKGTAADLMTQHLVRGATEPASSKQIWFLRRNGVDVPSNITKREASRQIAQLKGPK